MRRNLTTRLAALLIAGITASAAAVQIQDLVRLKGSESSKIVGLGLVTGLQGTGDGGKFLPAMRPLAAVIQRLIDPNVGTVDLADGKNVALVALTATLPPTGVREGDHVDIHVTALGPAKSLAGGRLFLVPMTGPLPNSPVYAFAEGPITIENPATPNVGTVARGAQITRDVMAQYIDRFGQVTLVIDEHHASWPTANNLSNLINGVLAPDGESIAKALDQKNIVVKVPEFERANPSAFISQILRSFVDPSQLSAGARVIINDRTGTIVISGDVQISPVIISHKGMTITTITPPIQPTEQSRVQDEVGFVSIDPDNRGGAQLGDLLTAFNQLKVDAPDRIAIIKEIHRSGKLHAQLIIE